jgi:hypothetical protein
MGTISETGHAKNLANFNEMRSYVSGYDADYKPAKASIGLDALQTLSDDARNALADLNEQYSVWRNAVIARDLAFKPFSNLITRIMNALRASDTPVEADESVRMLIRKIRGKRVSAKLTDEEKQSLAAEGKEIREISSSQTSIDNRLENFHRLIKLLSGFPLYAPNEPDLAVQGLSDLYDDLMSKNAAVVAAYVAVSNARIVRNTIFYKENTGLVDIAFAVKAYVKSRFGAASPQNKQISKLEFRPVKV